MYSRYNNRMRIFARFTTDRSNKAFQDTRKQVIFSCKLALDFLPSLGESYT